MKHKNPKIGAEKAGKHITIAMNHLNKAVAIMREYGLYTKEAENSDCICDLAQLESYLIDVEMGCDE
jgi:hypothetical protein